MTQALDTAPVAPRVFDYIDYRAYLRDYYGHKKATSRSFSYRAFARLAGIASHSYIKMVIGGQRNFSAQSARRVGRICDLDRDELQYFLALVNWNQAETMAQKQAFWREVLDRRPRADFHRLSGEQLSLLTDWRTVAILDTVRLRDFEPNARWIAGRLRGDVPVEDVQRIVDDLLTLGVVERHNGSWKLRQETLFAGGDIPNEVVQLFHHQVAQVGLRALVEVPVERREFSATTITIRNDQLPELKEEIREFQTRILERVAPVHDGDEVFQLNIQFFPLTEVDEK